MQKDFHYNVIRILAEKSGFTANEAQIIAYSSQFVDDATEFSPIKIPEDVKCDFSRLNENILDPVCTAHKGLQFLGDFKKSVQMKIYFSFHFLPPEIYTNQKNYDYITKSNSNFGKALMNKAIENFNSNTNSRTYNLIALGIALHTYADTWSHQGFSGRKSTEENNVEDIKLWSDKKWDNIKAINRLRNLILPEIGHAEAYHYPDLPYLNWEYKKNAKLKQITRNNLDIFINAVENIYNYLSKISPNAPQNISEIKPQLIKGLSYVEDDYKKRAEKYQKIFPEIGFHYNPEDWKNEVLNTKSKKFSTDIINREKPIYKWLIFHQAALDQRNYVIERIKPL
ncbi:MAG: hypothetical protein JXR68_04405 [Bacteroidales bacterium]|nr:hypothetical protein [Bacteroidales bacterium]